MPRTSQPDTMAPLAEGSKHSSKSSKHNKHEKDSERKHKKRKKYEDDGRKHKKRKNLEDNNVHIVDDDPNDDDMWVEKNIDMEGERVLATDIPTAESLTLMSSVDPQAAIGTELPPSHPVETKLKRDDWMLGPTVPPALPMDIYMPEARRMQMEDQEITDGYGEPAGAKRTLAGSVDFFSSLGTEIKKKEKPDRPDPDKPMPSSKEINKNLSSIDFDTPIAPPKAVTPGGPGSQWRMMRLRKVYETCEEECLDLETVAIERFGSLEAFEEAKEEKRILDEREGKKCDRGRTSERTIPRDRESGVGSGGGKRFMFTDIGGSGGSSRSSSFRRPAGYGTGARETSAPSTPTPESRLPANKRLEMLKSGPSRATSSPLSQAHTPIPSVMTPPSVAAGSRGRALSPSSLNRLQAKVLRAKLMNDPNAKRLEEEYEKEARRAHGEVDESGVRTKTEVLPTLDGRGRLYDVGHGEDDGERLPGNKRKREEKFETHDRKTGKIIRYNADDDTTTLGEMLRQEKFGAGMADQKNLDAQFARQIMGDGKFENDLDYIDDNAEKLGRQKMRSDAMKRQFAINDYKRTQKALASCNFCYGEDDALPKAPMVATGTRVYLSCTLTEELVEGHCLIVPIQHHLCMLEGDDDVWDEVRNFMKCLMRMYAEEDKGVVFYETVVSLKWQKHTAIECVPLPWEQYDLLPGYFKESILTSGSEWSQHKKLIDFSSRPGGFRRAMVPNLAYFMVQFDYKGEKGYGHVIEGKDTADGDEETFGLGDTGEKGGDFPSYFAGEIIGNMLEMEPRKWRRPRKVDFGEHKRRVFKFRQKYQKFDWTGMVEKE